MKRLGRILPRLPRGRLAAALLAILALTGACRRGSPVPDASADGGYNLLVVTLDTTRADHLGAYGFAAAHTPTLDRLAREGVRFTSCHTSVPLTLPAHCTLFTGREPPAHRVRNNGTYVLPADETTLAEVFQRAGFSTRAMIAAFVLEGKFGLNQGFDVYDDVLEADLEGSSFNTQTSADKMAAKALSWLDSQSADRPFFAWLHFYDPHAPYAPPPRWAERFPNDRYSGEIAFMDEQLGVVIDRLRERDLLDRTLLVLAGDHGEGLDEHGEKGHGIFAYEETLQVPLIVWQPRLFKNRTVSAPVGLVDVAPTLLDLYRLAAPAGIQGLSFAGLLGGAETAEPTAQTGRYFESMQGMEEMGWAPLTGLLRGSYKFIQLPRPELYDLAADPHERRNLFLQKNLVAREMGQQLQERLSRITSRVEASRHSLNGSDLDSLRALGYLTSPTPAPVSGPPVDPKQGITVVNRLTRAARYVIEKDLDAAARILDELRAEKVDRSLPRFYDHLFELNRARNDPRACEAALREALERFPAMSRFRLQLAELLKDQGRPAEAEALLLQTARDRTTATKAHVLLAQISKSRKDMAAALKHMRDAGESEPGNLRLQLELAGLENEAGEQAAALETLHRLLERDPNASALNDGQTRELATLLSRLGEAKRAARLLSTRIARKPDDAANLSQLGLAQLDSGDGMAAEPSLQRAIQIDPRQSLALSALGTIRLNAFRRERRPELLQQAADYYRRALEVDPKLVTAVNGQGVIRLFGGDLPGAIQAWREVLRIDPGFVNAYFNLAIAQLGIGRRDEARRTLQELRRRFTGRLTPAENRQLEDLLRECGG